MATKITLRNPDTGLTETGYYGFSWATLFFGFLPALFRRDFVTFLIVVAVTTILGCATSEILGSFFIGPLVFYIAWAFFFFLQPLLYACSNFQGLQNHIC